MNSREKFIIRIDFVHALSSPIWHPQCVNSSLIQNDRKERNHHAEMMFSKLISDSRSPQLTCFSTSHMQAFQPRIWADEDLTLIELFGKHGKWRSQTCYIRDYWENREQSPITNCTWELVIGGKFKAPGKQQQDQRFRKRQRICHHASHEISFEHRDVSRLPSLSQRIWKLAWCLHRSDTH